MGLLNYHNITNHRPDILMRKTFDGLKNFYDFLSRTKQYLESDAAVKRLSWLPATRKEEIKESNKANKKKNEKDINKVEQETGFWVQLKEPKSSPNESENTFKAFLDDNNKAVYEAQAIGINQVNQRVSFDPKLEIKILDIDPHLEQICLEREPKLPDIVLRPNTWPIICQIRALQALQDMPSFFHFPLLRFFEANDHAHWPLIEHNNMVEDWRVLTDANRAGTSDQRKFVNIALNTPDFAFLEGPPGSGKTTAICELIIQLTAQNKRVLLCASTHVAVDNVLERLMDEKNDFHDSIIPIRIGDRRNVSELAEKYQLETFVTTERKRLLDALHKNKPHSGAQSELFKQLNSGKQTIQKMVLEAANVICGTTIGLLQHPDIKNKGVSNPQFDVMIIDEASKTTFQEFLVPALLAKRWILVGDPKQLSPYVDDEETAINIQPCLPDINMSNACVDVFMASRQHHQHRASVIATQSKDVYQLYHQQAKALHVDCVQASPNNRLLPIAGIVIDSAENLALQTSQLPLDICHIRAKADELVALRRRVLAYKKITKRNNESLPVWQDEIAWRIARHYEQRQNEQSTDSNQKRKSTGQKLREQLEQLLPSDEDKKEATWHKIDAVRRVALPSILESLQHGFERNQRQKKGTALSDGLPEYMLETRHVLLSQQHRMHPEIAEFPHQNIYQQQALFTDESMIQKRHWDYQNYKHRAIWFDIKGDFDRKNNCNRPEAKQIIKHLEQFAQWAKTHRHPDGASWQLAILTFYRGQERELRAQLKQWSGQPHANNHFYVGNKKSPFLSVQLCTVDRFQGHEADMVFLSFANTYATSFLQSPNRLNVAITRARYQLVIFGHRNGLEKSNSILGALAKHTSWSTKL